MHFLKNPLHAPRKWLTVSITSVSMLLISSITTAANITVAADITALGERPSVKSALAFFVDENERNLHDLIELTEIPAPPFKEAKRAARLVEMIRAIGLKDVSIDEVGNVIARRRGTQNNETVALVAHIDTVFPIETDVTVRREGDTFYAPGIGDNSRGLVVMLSIIRALEKFNIQTKADLLFVGSVGEEGLGDLRGVRHLLRDGGPKIDSFIAIDGGRDSRIVHQAVGSTRYRISYRGDGGHSWGAFGSANPHHAMGRAIALFIEQATPITLSGPKTSFNIGRIGGGTSINSITAESWFEVDMRSGDQSKLDAIEATFLSSVAQALEFENAARRRGSAIRVDIKPVGKRPAGNTPASSPLVLKAVAALKAVGVEAKLKASSTDANIAMAKGIPAITISRGGRGKNAHSPSESWQNKDSHLALQSGFLLLLSTAKISE